jgi:hypothetical protein
MQCQQSGEYRFELRYNGTIVDEPRFVLAPTLPPGSYAVYNQVSYPNVTYDNRCRNPSGGASVDCDDYPEATPYTIKQLGCALTSMGVVSSYYGAPADPATLNGFMYENGYFAGGSVIWTGNAAWADRSVDSTFQFVDGASYSPTAVRAQICRNGPQIVELKNLASGTQHFAVAVGMTPNEDDVLIHDPGTTRVGPHPVTDRYEPISLRLYQGPERIDTLIYLNEEENLIVSFHSPGEILITDPQGRRTGVDPITGATYDEIPAAFHEVWEVGVVEEDGVFGADYDDPVRRVHIRDAMDGDYSVRVTGTGEGHYDLQVIRTDLRSSDRTVVADVPITTGEVHSYRFSFDGDAVDSGVPLRLGGAFTGGGQRADVDEILTYSRPAQRRTELPPGTTAYPLMISYGAGLDPTSFSAELNRTDVSSLFAPAPGVAETVDLPLGPGRNVLVLKADGLVGSRTATDSDRLTFTVR